LNKKTGNDNAKLKEPHLTRILETTKRMLSDVGSEKMTIREIAAVSGVAPGTLYNRFGGKDTLINLAIRDHYERHVKMSFLDRAKKGPLLTYGLRGLRFVARTCLESPRYSKAMVTIYFKGGANQNVHDSMYRMFNESWISLLHDMRDAGFLRDWVSIESASAEISDRTFGIIFNWAQGRVPDEWLSSRFEYGALSILLGASQGEQAVLVEILLKKLSRKTVLKPGRHSLIK
jgi:AcrR family transcriptional regulator